MYELWRRRNGGPWRSIRSSSSEEALQTAARREAAALRDDFSPHRTEYFIGKVGNIPVGDEEPYETVRPFPSLPEEPLPMQER